MSPSNRRASGATSAESEPVLSTREVARLLRVSEATIKRWADDRLIACVKTPGGHRKFRLEDVDAFRVSRGFGEPNSEMLPEGAAGIDRLISLTLAGDSTALANVLIAALGRGEVLEDVCDDLVRELLVQVGEKWACGELGVAEEHVVSQSVIDALGQVAVMVQTDPKRGLALTGCLSDERHDIGSRMASLVLRKYGYRVMQLGADTPVSDVISLAERERVSLVALSCVMGTTALRSVAALEMLASWAQRTTTQVILGGAGYEELPSLPAPIARAESLATFSRMVEQLTQTPQ